MNFKRTLQKNVRLKSMYSKILHFEYEVVTEQTLHHPVIRFNAIQYSRQSHIFAAFFHIFHHETYIVQKFYGKMDSRISAEFLLFFFTWANLNSRIKII